ncbi:MAG: hypothetical protein WA418_32165 [Bradyrhizobium sp.]
MPLHEVAPIGRESFPFDLSQIEPQHSHSAPEGLSVELCLVAATGALMALGLHQSADSYLILETALPAYNGPKIIFTQHSRGLLRSAPSLTPLLVTVNSHELRFSQV